MWSSNPSSLRNTLCISDIPPTCGLLHGGWVFDKTVSLPLPLVSMWSFYPLFRGTVQLVFRSFWENCPICSYRFGVSVVEVSSGSSYPTILNHPLSLDLIFPSLTDTFTDISPTYTYYFNYPLRFVFLRSRISRLLPDSMTFFAFLLSSVPQMHFKQKATSVFPWLLQHFRILVLWPISLFFFFFWYQQSVSLSIFFSLPQPSSYYSIAIA